MMSKHTIAGSARGSRAMPPLGNASIAGHSFSQPQHASRVRSQGYALLLAILTALFASAVAQESQPLPPNARIERELTSTQTHIYRIPLKAGQFVHFDVFQKSIDLQITLVAPDKKIIEIVNLTPFGLPETFSAIATTRGNYELRIQTISDPGLKGRYELRAEIKDTATATDKKRMQAERLMNDYRRQGETQQSLATAQQARMLWAELGERFWEGIALTFMSASHNGLKQKENALTTLEQALAIMREVKSRSGEAMVLANLASYHSSIGQKEKAISFYEQAISIAIETKDYARAALNLRTLADQQVQLDRYDDRVITATRLLELTRSHRNRKDEAGALILLGVAVWEGQSKLAKAQEYLEAAQAIALELGDRSMEFSIQGHLALLVFQTGKVEKALEYAENARKIAISFGNPRSEARVINTSLVRIYRALGQKEKVRELLEQALTIYREAKDTENEIGVLFQLSALSSGQTPDPKQLANLEQILKIAQEKYPTQEGRLVEVYQLLAEHHYYADAPAKAIEAGEKALALVRKVNIPWWEASTLRSLGVYHRKLKQYEKAIQYHEQALRLAQASPLEESNFSRAGDAIYFVSLMKDWKEVGNADTAIYYGKRGINAFQEARGKLRQASDQQNLQQQLQQSFLANNEQYYRDLADLLISQARLPEAEQVLRMLKEEEYFEYIRGDNNNAPKGEKATLTPKEEAADKRYREVADKLAALGAERSALLNKPSRTEAENKRLANIESDLVIAGGAFQKFLDQLSNELKTTKDAGKVSQLRDAQGMMEDLRELGNGAVALYTVVSEDTFSIVLTTADVQKAYQVPIKAAELNRKVLAFRTALQNPTLDPLPLAQELYKILLAPVENDLRAANAKLLMWSLDGVLRYVPMAALHDGRQYLVESFRHAVFTPASNARLHFAPSKNWRALGLGVTKAHGEGIPALPGVAEEMRGIIKTDDNASGVLPGTIKLDEQFTEESMLTSLRESNNVIHIASHFKFQPGNETNSALLLGDGQFLSLAQIKTWQNPFRGVELLTLSACNTATSGSANGKEIEGFGVLAQQKGARAVIASLWPVADRSTMRLMQEFYQLRESGLSKADALRQSQSKMLRGELTMPSTTTTREIVHAADKTASLPKFKANAHRPFAHPYYWAPFILIGNWK